MSNPFDSLNPWFLPKKPVQKSINDWSLFPPPPAPPLSTRIFPSPPQKSGEALSSLVVKPVKPRVFVSYHHKNDQWWYDQFSRLFAGGYDLFTDTSIGRKIDSDDPLYQSRKIREDHISGSSTTIVLIGAETGKRKHVDWEVYATLAKKHALLGIALPTHVKGTGGAVIVPSRLYDNIVSGFATWIHWTNDAAAVSNAITNARQLAKNATRIVNSRPQLGRNFRKHLPF